MTHTKLPHTIASAAATPLNRTPAPSEHDRLTKQTQKWVAQTFFATLLKQMHNSPFKSEMFEGGRGGEAFSSLYDQHMAEHMSRGAGRKLVNAIVSRIEANAAYSKSARKEPRTKSPHGINPAPEISRHGASTRRA